LLPFWGQYSIFTALTFAGIFCAIDFGGYPMGTQQLLFVILGVLIIGVAIAVGLALFGAQQLSSSRDAILNDLNHLAAIAYQFRTSLRTMGGGEGSYSTFTISPLMALNDNGTYTIIDAQVTTITFKAIAVGNPSNTIQVTVYSNGRLDNWTYGGDFR
jgi:hypothetical protein